jgi:methyltransferase (TIGR00027 family)
MIQNNCLEKETSKTAMATAFMRALAFHDPKEKVKGNDYLAEVFLEGEQKKPLKDLAVRAWVMKNRIAPGAYEFMIARTAFFDGIVEQGLKENVEQLVFLGAGYDSRPYRFGKFIRDTKIFELDSKPTQERKKECLQRAQISISKQISFVPINFETDHLKVTLEKAGFSQGKKAVFIWEGVTYYLSGEAVDNTLALVRSNSPSGSSIAFDYASLSDEALNEDGAKELREHMKSRYSNEPTKFAIPAGKIEAFLAERGFEVVEHLTAPEMNERYLSVRGYSDVGKVPSLFCLVYAKVIN